MNYCESCKHGGNCEHEWRYSKLVYGCEKYAKVMTNEEWLRSATTEEKAEFSMRVFLNCTWCLDGGNPKECPFDEFSEHCPAESKENMVKWLKQPHTNE